MNATETVIAYLDDPENVDDWNYIAEMSDPEGEGEYEDVTSVGMNARTVLRDSDVPDALDEAVDWDAVGTWLVKSFREADKSGYAG